MHQTSVIMVGKWMAMEISASNGCHVYLQWITFSKVQVAVAKLVVKTIDVPAGKKNLHVPSCVVARIAKTSHLKIVQTKIKTCIKILILTI